MKHDQLDHETLQKIITGELRDGALSSAEDHLADALKSISHIDSTIPEVKTAILENHQAIRDIKKCTSELSEISTALIQDMGGHVASFQEFEARLLAIFHRTETLMQTLLEKEIITKEELEKTYKEKVIPAYLESLKKRESGKTKTAEEGHEKENN